MIQDPIRFPDCAVGLRVTHKFGGHGTVVDFAELASEPQVVPVDWDQPGRHPPRVPAASLTVAGDIPFADVCRTFGLRALIYRQTCLMLANGDVEAARASHTTHCSTWWDVCHFEQLTLRMAEDRKTRAEAALESSRLLAEEDLRKELERKSEARKRQQVSHGNEVEGLLRTGNFQGADSAYELNCKGFWSRSSYAKVRERYVKEHEAEELKRQLAEQEFNQRQEVSHRNEVEGLLRTGNFQGADSAYELNCKGFWSRSSYAKVRERYVKEHEAEELKRQLAQQEFNREVQRNEVRGLLRQLEIDAADRAYEVSCRNWWDQSAYAAERAPYFLALEMETAIRIGTLGEVAAVYRRLEGKLSSSDVAELAFRKTSLKLARIGIRLDREQVIACAQPTRHRLIRARAGSGKTRTLAALAALAIQDENLSPDQVLILAFNSKAAAEIGDRVRGVAGVAKYRNARTFHSLAWRLADHAGRQLVFDDGNLQVSRKAQSSFVERVIHSILNPAFREKLYEFFRREIEQVERIGSNLVGGEYFAYRRAMMNTSLNGEGVRSNGEKFIADFLFEHGISYVYEKVYSWDAKNRLQGSPYRPDFCITAQGRDFILEHWAIDPADPAAQVPDWWTSTTSEYRQQIEAKRQFWKLRGVSLLETHAGLLLEGREAFESELHLLLTGNGIACRRLELEILVKRVAEAPRTISRLATLFLGFISRAKKRGWGVDKIAQVIAEHPDPEPRNRVFHELAIRAYAEYERLLTSELKLDFDDLMISATRQVRELGGIAELRLDGDSAVSLRDVRWILLDEFQDFSELYYQLIQAILTANPEIRVMAVGDDWQAINGFAGAQLSYFNGFGKYFDGASATSINTNYRSSRSIVNAGNVVMAGRGASALAASAQSGHIEVRPVDKIWIESEGLDGLCLAAAVPNDGGKPTATQYQVAKALKACVSFIVGSTFIESGRLCLRKVLLLARTGYAYGLPLEEFRDHLLWVLKQHPALGLLVEEIDLDAMTAHKAKGKEARTVVVLEATARQFPKVHADNQLFSPFGVSAEDTLAEERRLFYVAVTRAEHRLLFLSETRQESPYLDELGLLQQFNLSAVSESFGKSSTNSMGELATVIKRRLDRVLPLEAIRQNITSVAIPILDGVWAEIGALPTVPYFDGDLCAELAWPSAAPPIAVLTGPHKTHAKIWRARGWRVYEA